MRVLYIPREAFIVRALIFSGVDINLLYAQPNKLRYDGSFFFDVMTGYQSDGL